MFNFDKRDEGYLVTDADGRGVADVTTTEFVTTHDAKLRDPHVTTTVKLPQEKWRIHFASVKLTPVTLAAFLSELKDQE